MKTLIARMGRRIDLTAVRRIRQNLSGIITQLPVRWYESVEGAVLLRTYTLLCSVEVYLSAKESRLGLGADLAAVKIAKFLGEVCSAEAMEQSVVEARSVYAEMQSGAISPSCALGAAYKPLYDEGYVYVGMNTNVLEAIRRNYAAVSSVISPVQEVEDGSLLFPKGESGAALISAVEGLFRLYAGAAHIAIGATQDAKTSKYRLLTVFDHVGKALSGMSQTSIRGLSKTKEG